MHVINATKFLTQYKGTSQFTQYLIIILGNRLQKKLTVMIANFMIEARTYDYRGGFYE